MIEIYHFLQKEVLEGEVAKNEKQIDKFRADLKRMETDNKVACEF